MNVLLLLLLFIFFELHLYLLIVLFQNGWTFNRKPEGKRASEPESTVTCVSVCLPDPVSSSLAQSVMSMASSHSQHSHISTDTMSSMSGSYLAGAEGEPGGDEGVEAEGEETQDVARESRGPLQQDGVRTDAGREIHPQQLAYLTDPGFVFFLSRNLNQ